MNTTSFAQPQNQLGQEIAQILAAAPPCRRVVLVSAFTALRTVLRLRESLLAVRDAGGVVRMVLGVDLGGTSREVLTELSGWNCDIFVYHNPIVRATFHPKVYLFERDDTATLFVGSNNLTDGGLFTNYEATTRYTFSLPVAAGVKVPDFAGESVPRPVHSSFWDRKLLPSMVTVSQ